MIKRRPSKRPDKHINMCSEDDVPIDHGCFWGSMRRGSMGRIDCFYIYIYHRFCSLKLASFGRSQRCFQNNALLLYSTEGSLEVKLPTTWTDGKAEVGRVREEKKEKKREDQRRERVRRKKMKRCAKR